MPTLIPVVIRQQIIERHTAGESLKRIAEDVGRPYESVRNVWRLYRKEGRIAPSYERCGKKIEASRRVYRGAIYLKRLHPTWGAGLIRQVIIDKWADEKVADARSLQRWFVREKLNTPRVKKKREQQIGRGKTPHAVWEMDSREAIPLATGEKVTWLLVSDEASGAILSGEVFPPRQSQSIEG